MSTPVRVCFTLRTPAVVPGVASSLDAVLSWARVQMAEFHLHPAPLDVQHDLGLCRHQVGDQWCHMASLLDFEWASDPDQIHYIKRMKPIDFGDAWVDGILRKKATIDPTRGLVKAGSYLQPIRWTRSVSAHAMVDDMDRFMALLPWVTHIGKLRHKDFGAVSDFTVTEDVAANEGWAHRSLPLGSNAATNHCPGVGCLRAPYWKRENFTDVLMPAT